MLPDGRASGAGPTVPPAPSLEQLLEAPPALLDPHQREPEFRDGVTDEVERPLVLQLDEDGPAIGHGVDPSRDERGGEAWGALLDVDGKGAGPLGEGGEGGRPDQPTGVDRDEVVADPLDLA